MKRYLDGPACFKSSCKNPPAASLPHTHPITLSCPHQSLRAVSHVLLAFPPLGTHFFWIASCLDEKRRGKSIRKAQISATPLDVDEKGLKQGLRSPKPSRVSGLSAPQSRRCPPTYWYCRCVVIMAIFLRLCEKQDQERTFGSAAALLPPPHTDLISGPPAPKPFSPVSQQFCSAGHSLRPPSAGWRPPAAPCSSQPAPGATRQGQH